MRGSAGVKRRDVSEDIWPSRPLWLNDEQNLVMSHEARILLRESGPSASGVFEIVSTRPRPQLFTNAAHGASTSGNARRSGHQRILI